MFSSKLDSTKMDKSAEPKKPAPLRKITRQSRSATRAKYVTPANRRRAQSYDPITPKVNQSINNINYVKELGLFKLTFIFLYVNWRLNL